jgi:hypothetical protein
VFEGGGWGGKVIINVNLYTLTTSMSHYQVPKCHFFKFIWP